MTKSWVGLALAALLGCDGGSSRSSLGATDGGTGGGEGGPSDAAGGPEAAVGPGPITPGRITLTNTTPAGGSKLLWVGFNEGDGPWQTVEAVGNVYAFQVKARFGLAFVCEQFGGSTAGEVVHATPAELPALTVNCGAPPATVGHKLGGKISGLGPADSVDVQAASTAGAYMVDFRNPPATMYQGQLAPDTYDVAAFALIGRKPSRAIFLRDLVLSGDTVVDLDFAARGIAMSEQPLTLLGDSASAPQPIAASARLFSSRGFFQATDVSEQLPTSFLAFPRSVMRPGDTQELEVVSMAGAMPRFSLRGTIRGFREPGPMEVQLPPDLSSVQVTAAATTPNLRPRMSFAAYPNALFYQLSVTQLTGNHVTTWLAIFSAAWLEGQTSYDFPDFSAARGFQSSFVFQPQPQGTYEYSCDAVTSTRDFSRTINSDPATRDGAQMTYARKTDRAPIR